MPEPLEKGQDQKHDGDAEDREADGIERFIPVRQRRRVAQYFALDEDKPPQQAIRNDRQHHPVPADLCHPAVYSEQPPVHCRNADAGAEKEVARIEHDAPVLDRERPELEPIAWAIDHQPGNVERSGDGQHDREELRGPASAAQREAIDRIEQVGRQPVQQAGNQVEGEQNPEKPDRPARPRTFRDHIPPKLRKADFGMVPQRDRVIGERNHRERADHERQAKPEQAVRHIVRRSLPGDPGPGEQPRQEKEHRHEEAVGGEHDHVEAEEVLRIGVAEIGVGDHRVMQQHHQRQEGAGAVERQVARFCLGYCARVGLPHGGKIDVMRVSQPARGVGCCRREPDSASLTTQRAAVQQILWIRPQATSSIVTLSG